METPVGILRRVIWEKPIGEALCVPLPFGGERCTDLIRGAVRLVQKDTGYFAELELLGEVIEYSLINTCYPAYTVGIASLEVCISDIELTGSTLKSMEVSIKLCIGRWRISRCWDIFKGKIRFFLVDTLELYGDLFKPGFTPEKILVGIEQ